MNRGGIAQRLIRFAKAMTGSLPGGLAHINVVAAILFGAISGSAVAATSAIGGIMAPRMDDAGYDRGYSAAVNITSSTTGLVIPPSNILIVYSLASGGASIAALFLAGYLPGLLVGGVLMLTAGTMAARRKYPRDRRVPVGELVRTGVEAVPSLILLVIIIGGIVAGIFTATEAAAVAVVYALGLSLIYREVTAADLPNILLQTVRTTAIVMFLVGTSIAMSWAITFEQIPQFLSSALLSLSSSPMVVLVLVNVSLLIVGTFMDMTPAVLIFTPIFLPVVVELGLDPVHFGIIMVLNLCIGLCTPPVGTVLFVGSSVARVSIVDVVRPLLPFLIAMILALLLVTFVPQLSLWLPSKFGY